jgi:hypothetical protein
MTTVECVSCARPLANAFVCAGCLAGLIADLDAVPELLVQLEVTYARLHRLGIPSEGRGEQLPYHVPASEARYVLGDTLRAQASALSSSRGLDLPIYLSWRNPAGHARWLGRHADSIRLDEDAEKIIDEIADAVAMARRTIDRPPELVVLGPCGVEGCTRIVYAPIEAERASCDACLAEHDVDERRTELLDAAADQLVTATTALGWSRALMKTSPPRGTFDSWVSRGRVLSRGPDRQGHHLYRFGEVADVVASWLSHRKRAA